MVVSHLGGVKGSVGDGDGDVYNSVDTKLSLSYEGASGAGNLIGMGGISGARGVRGRYGSIRTPTRFEDRKGLFHWESRSSTTAVMWASKGTGGEQTREQEQ